MYLCKLPNVFVHIDKHICPKRWKVFPLTHSKYIFLNAMINICPLDKMYLFKFKVYYMCRSYMFELRSLGECILNHQTESDFNSVVEFFCVSHCCVKCVLFLYIYCISLYCMLFLLQQQQPNC